MVVCHYAVIDINERANSKEQLSFLSARSCVISIALCIIPALNPYSSLLTTILPSIRKRE